jgi:type VI secretion system secreted protein VgrG
MEQEGIYYYFKHEIDKHTLVLSDSVGSHEAFPGYEKLPYFPPDEQALRERDHIYDWNISQSMEIYDYPGEYLQTGDGENYVRARIEELQAEHEQVQGQGNARGLSVGSLFELTDYLREDQNREYLIVSATHQVESDAYSSGAAAASEEVYSCSFTALHSKKPFRPVRSTPKPMVQGPQTAVVVGPSGDEIHTDEYGRVKVSFHWDRKSKSDENSSCWVRVAQVWAGTKWGGIQIPRIGQEVIIEFLEGDPDRPIITGRVYNNDNMPPYDLPANATQSGIKSRSSKGGSADNFNEIRFEDKIGDELVYIHAEKDQANVVENDETIAVGNDRAESIGRDRSLEVGRDKSEKVSRDKAIQVLGGHSEKIDSSMTIMVGSNLSETVAINYAETVGAAMELTVGGALAISVGAAMSEAVGGAKSEAIGQSKSENIGKNNSLSVGKNLNETVKENRVVEIGKDLKEVVKGQHKETVKKEFIMQAQKIQILAKDEINVKTGKAELIMKKNGDITIKGKKINIKGSGDVVIKGSKIKEN